MYTHFKFRAFFKTLFELQRLTGYNNLTLTETHVINYFKTMQFLPNSKFKNFKCLITFFL